MPHWLHGLLQGRGEGEHVQFPQSLVVAGVRFNGAVVIRHLQSASRPQLLRLVPGEKEYIVKFGDLRQEAWIMAAIRNMNHRWHIHDILFRGRIVQALVYDIIPLDVDIGLVEVISQARTYRELADECPHEVPWDMRVSHYLEHNEDSLNRLASTLVAYLTSCYALGLGDGHDDNIMLRSNGAVFRIDFGFAFGKTPLFDAPALVVPRAIRKAIGDERWGNIVYYCRLAMNALGSEPHLCYECFHQVPNVLVNGQGWTYLQDALPHASQLKMEVFLHQVENAPRFSFNRLVKNVGTRVVNRQPPSIPVRRLMAATGPNVLFLAVPAAVGALATRQQTDRKSVV